MTTETNAERLKRIKSEWNGDDILCVADTDWLIQQAELIETYEESIKGYAFAVEIYSDMPVKEAMEKLTELAEQEFGESDEA